MASTTKERILNEALSAFSEYGYKGTNLRDFADRLGLSKSALYKHFESKDDILNALIDQMEAYYGENFITAVSNSPVPENWEELMNLTVRMFSFTVHDERVVKIRKLLLTEQYHNDRIRQVARAHFTSDLEEAFEKVFAGMMKNGIVKGTDAAMLAFSYVAPISTLVHSVDRDPDTEAEAMDKLKAFIAYFSEINGIRE